MTMIHFYGLALDPVRPYKTRYSRLLYGSYNFPLGEAVRIRRRGYPAAAILFLPFQHFFLSPRFFLSCPFILRYTSRSLHAHLRETVRALLFFPGYLWQNHGKHFPYITSKLTWTHPEEVSKLFLWIYLRVEEAELVFIYQRSFQIDV